MKVKNFIASDIKEAMIKVRNEMGKDAIIIHTRKIRKKGIKGIFGKSDIEILAAIEEKSAEKKQEIVLEKKEKVIDINSMQREKLKSKHEFEVINNEINDLKAMLKDVLSRVDETPDSAEKVDLDQVCINMLENDVAKPIVYTLSNSVKAKYDGESGDLYKKRIMEEVKLSLGVPYSIESNEGQKICVLVGPTGVGKTTTLSKIAARLTLVENRSVALITADTFRIAAVDQLKTYAEILGIPLTVIYENYEIENAIQKYRDKDVILIDTAGRNHKDVELIQDINFLIENIDDPDVFLVLSMTTSYKNLVSIIDSYKFLEDYKLIFTKLDESSSLGNILNIKMMTGKELSYTTFGQSVPDDIEVADIGKITNRIIGGLDEGSSN